MARIPKCSLPSQKGWTKIERLHYRAIKVTGSDNTYSYGKIIAFMLWSTCQYPELQERRTGKKAWNNLANENCRQYGTEQLGAKAFEWFAVKSARMAGATLVLMCPSGACWFLQDHTAGAFCPCSTLQGCSELAEKHSAVAVRALQELAQLQLDLVPQT